MKSNLLEKINSPKDLKKISVEDLPKLAQELRDFIIEEVSKNEGHLGASLGVIELTIALHYIFDTPYDLLIWDVGHQAYGHKIVTERKKVFHSNRKLHGISGFPTRTESAYDAFGVGHSSTSISAVLGMALASNLKGDTKKQHIAVIGDASIASGMAFEGLNHAGVTNANMLVILNDNSIGIDPSVGALKNYFTNIKESTKTKQNNIIESLNFEYSGPIDGHDLPKLLQELERLKNIQGIKFLHIITTKGKGFPLAEENQVKYHAPGRFDAVTGEILKSEIKILPPKFQDVFGITLLELATNNKKIVGITPAMPTGSSLNLMMQKIPERAFDVGIAEQHAVTLAAGMATQGMVVFCTIYSTFLQRAYDQVIHDVALQNIPVIFCVDRAGLVGEDGATHHGVFDIAYLSCIPNIIIFAPLNEIELRNILYTAQLGLPNPIAIRYPRGRGTIINWQLPFEKIEIGKGFLLKKGTNIAIISTGTIGNNVTEALQNISTSDNFSHYHFPTIKPLDLNLLESICKQYSKIITIEDGVIHGGFGSLVQDFCSTNNYNIPVVKLGIPDQFIMHGTVLELQKICNIDVGSLCLLFEKMFEK